VTAQSVFDVIDEDMMSELVGMEVKGEAPDGFAEFVRRPEHLLDWICFLRRLRSKVDGHMAKSRAHLETLKPLPAELPSLEYLEAKRSYERDTRGRVRFARGVDDRIREACAMARRAGVVDAGDLLAVVLRAAELLDAGDVDNAHAALRAAIDRQGVASPTTEGGAPA
jgi:hypothetical protein